MPRADEPWWLLARLPKKLTWPACGRRVDVAPLTGGARDAAAGAAARQPIGESLRVQVEAGAKIPVVDERQWALMLPPFCRVSPSSSSCPVEVDPKLRACFVGVAKEPPVVHRDVVGALQVAEVIGVESRRRSWLVLMQLPARDLVEAHPAGVSVERRAPDRA
jgi:hypothetical protein